MSVLTLLACGCASQIVTANDKTSLSTTSELYIVVPPGNNSFNKALPLLANYLQQKLEGIDHVHPIIPRSYQYTGEKFESGQVNAFLGGSFLSYILCVRELAVPLVLGEQPDGASTYHSVLLTRRNTPYNGIESVKDRRVTYVTEASSGEFYARKFFSGKAPTSIGDTTYIPSKSHELSVRYLQVGRADFAFVKNLVWEEIKERYPDLQVVDEDDGENPNNIFLVSKAVYATHGEDLKRVLTELHTDPDPMAQQVLTTLNLRRFIAADFPGIFDHTAQLVKDAGIDAKIHRFSR